MKSKTQNSEILEARKKVKQVITKKRIEIKDEIQSVDKLGEETIAIPPEDIELMFVGKLCNNLIKNDVRSQNMEKGYLASYKYIDAQTQANIKQYRQEFSDDFATSKKRIIKIAKKHPLCIKLKDIKGLTEYQLALVMAMIRDISKFDTPSKLMVYSGLASINGMPVTKANINNIKEYYTTQGKEFQGFNTAFSGRMFVIVDCLMRAQGYFYNMYVGIKARIKERCVNNDECFTPTAEEIKQSKGIMEIGRLYMKGRKNYSLDSFAHNNARRRIARTLLHIIWAEWRTINGLEVRHPYAIDYLGHKSFITLEDVLAYDKKVV